MKKLVILVLLLVPCLALSSLDLGVGVDLGVDVDIDKVDTSKATETDIELIPSLVLMLSPQTEVRPFAIVGLHKESDPDNIVGPVAADLSQIYLGIGGGLYYKFIQGQLVSLSIGPKASVVLTLAESGTSATVYDSYFNLALAIGLPVYLDAKLKDNLFLRTGLEIPGIQFSTEMTELAGVKTTTSNFTIL